MRANAPSLRSRSWVRVRAIALVAATASGGCARTGPEPGGTPPTLRVPEGSSDRHREHPDSTDLPAASWSVELFYLSQRSIERDCEAVAPVARTLRPGPNRADALLQALFAPLTEAENDRGLFSPHHGYVSAPDAPGLGEFFVGVTIQDGVAHVAFTSEAMAYLNQAACAQTAVKSSIERTLQQLPDVESIEYVVDGRIVVEWDA